MKNLFLPLVLVIWGFFACNPQKNDETMSVTYPETKTVDTVDTYFGTKVPDPYRWLEDDQSEETAQWVAAENKVTFGYLNKIPFKDAIKAKLEKLWNYEKIGAPTKHGDYFYFYKNDGLQFYIVLKMKMVQMRKFLLIPINFLMTALFQWLAAALQRMVRCLPT